MATKKAAPKPSWVRIDCAINQPLVVAPAELALAWPGGAPTGAVDVYLTYFQDVMKDMMKAMPDLKPLGHKDTPHFETTSEEDAKALFKRIHEFLKTKDPAVKAKKQGDFTSFAMKSGHKIVTASPKRASDAAIAAGREKDVWTAEAGGKPVLLWPAKKYYGGIRARVTDDGLLFVDADGADDALDAMVNGKPTTHGTWSFDRGLAVATWAGAGVKELRGFEAGKVSDLEAAVAKKPAVTAKPLDKEARGGAAIFKIAPGSYTAETGGGKTSRWLRFKR